MKHNEYYYSWNDVELRSIDGGGINTGHECNVCHSIVPSFHIDDHIEWHRIRGDDVELTDG